MTTPPPPQQPPQAQQPPQPHPPPVPPAAIPPATLAAMALPLAGLLLTAVSAAGVIAALKLRFELSALFWLAMLLVLSRIVMRHPPPVTGVIGAAGEQVSRMNAARRAQYVIASAERVTNAMLTARAHGGNVAEAGYGQVERERRYYRQHLDAMRNRATAAGKTDMAAAEYGPVLGWKSILDDRTSPECRRADGWNYYAWSMPDIGYPGSVHPSCRCKPAAPWPSGKLLPSRGLRFARAA